MEERIIKFRAWHEDAMSPGSPLSDWLVGCAMTGHGPDSKSIFMQFTGLHDKNGKEIYEGDILSDSRRNRWEMRWAGYGRWEAYPDNEYNINWKGWEVIGNIYENWKLLR